MTPNRAEADFINGVQNDIPDRLQRNKKGQTSNIDKPTYQVGDLVRLQLSREKPTSAPSFTRSVFRIAEARMQRQKGGAWQRNEYVVTYIIETLGFLAWRRRGRNMWVLTTSYGHATSQPGRYKLRYKAHVTNAGTNSRTDNCV